MILLGLLSVRSLYCVMKKETDDWLIMLPFGKANYEQEFRDRFG